MSIQEMLEVGTAQLAQAGISSARLDSLVLLEDTTGKERSWLLAHCESQLTPPQAREMIALLNRRAQREPLAYIRGQREFDGHTLTVTPAVLIPRPETETFIELLANLDPKSGQKLLDVGTGSGAIAISCKLRWPDMSVDVCDISSAALAVAKKNAQQLHAKITFYTSDLLEAIDQTYDVITANLPYVGRDWQRSPETDFEPGIALFAEDHGLELIKKLLVQAKDKLQPDGHLLLEADPRQLDAIHAFAKTLGYQLSDRREFAIVLRKLR